MPQKRQQGEEGTSSHERRQRRSSPSFRSLVLDVMNLQRLQNLVTPVVEPLFRRVVKEKVDLALRQHMINMERYGIRSFMKKQRDYELVSKEGSTAIEVGLVDAANGQVVSTGLGSSAKVEIVILRSDFGGESGDRVENWRLEEFARNIVREREGKKPLLIGDVILTLKDGKGLVGDFSFTDNSSWTRSRMFRLGTRLMDDIDGMRVRGAVSEPFIVKNRLREPNKKHHPPSLSDEVWRLENIRKDGPFHKSLSGGGVNTVQDFLTSLSLHPTRLRNILGNTMSTKNWEITVQHAETCVLDGTLYVYDGSTSPQTNGVVFNVVRQVTGVFKDGQYVSVDKLSDAEKVHAREMVISALENYDKVVTLGDESSLNVHPSLPSCTDHQDLSSQNIEMFLYSQQHNASSADFMQSSCPVGGASSFDDFLHNLNLMDIRYDQTMSFPNQVSDTLTNGMSCANEQLNYSEMDSTDIIDDFIPCPSAVPINKAQRAWAVLVFVLRWRFTIKRIMAKKTRVWAIQQEDDA